MRLISYGAREIVKKNGKRQATPEYKAWLHIKGRCYNPNDKAYKYYGGRGVRLSDKWSYNFDLFLADLGKRPSSKHSIDRINNDGDYEPGNCQWATRGEQARNRRTFSSNLSGFRGVYWFKPLAKYASSIQSDGDRIFLGYFNTKEEAALAYDCAAIQLHGKGINIL